ncbi:MAG TPA: DUF6538 domain-containing protein, partial [Azospirillaceae bacterium]|nr:DUF6538 domain-containing protein [Azospirillaceae bacterium]
MARNLYLRCVGGRWDWRRRIPSHLVERFGGRRELVRSIGSVPHAAAKERARQFTTAADELFQMIAKSPELTADQIDSLVADYFRHRLESKDAWRARFRPEDPEEHDRALATADTLAEGAGELLKMNDVGVATEAAQALLEKHGLVASKNNPVFGDLKRALLRAEAEVARLHAARLRGNYRTQPLDPLVTSALSNADEGVQPKAKRRKALALTECWYRYTEARTKAKAWGADMARLVADTHTLFLEWAGDKPLDSYSRADVAAFIEMLQCLPALRGKVPNFTGKPLSDLVAMTKANPSIACLSPRSVKKHANNLSTFFTWAVDQGIVTENPAKGVFKAPKRTTRRNEERSAWTVDQLKRLFSSPLYRGCKSAARRSEPGSMVIRDARYWLPLLGAFHPVRLEEIAQLRVEDIRQE